MRGRTALVQRDPAAIVRVPAPVVEAKAWRAPLAGPESPFDDLSLMSSHVQFCFALPSHRRTLSSAPAVSAPPSRQSDASALDSDDAGALAHEPLLVRSVVAVPPGVI